MNKYFMSADSNEFTVYETKLKGLLETKVKSEDLRKQIFVNIVKDLFKKYPELEEGFK